MQAEALSLSSGYSSFGKAVVYIANSSFAHNTAIAPDLVLNRTFAIAKTFNTLQGAGGKAVSSGQFSWGACVQLWALACMCLRGDTQLAN